MAQAEFPPGVSTDIPDPVREAVRDVLDAIMGPMTDFMDGMAKVNDYAAAGRKEDCEH